MKSTTIFICVLLALTTQTVAFSQENKAKNPLIYADVPDLSMIRVGDTYYMSSTTMHVNPGVPIMKSNDLVNWKLVSYAYETLEDNDDRLKLENGKSDYGRGSWASSLRFHNGIYYVSTFSGTTGKTYIFSTKTLKRDRGKKLFSIIPIMIILSFLMIMGKCIWFGALVKFNVLN